MKKGKSKNKKVQSQDKQWRKWKQMNQPSKGCTLHLNMISPKTLDPQVKVEMKRLKVEMKKSESGYEKKVKVITKKSNSKQKGYNKNK